MSSLRVDDRGHAGVLIADEVAGAAEVVVRELAEEHPAAGAYAATS